ncbi:response regulator transcription factor [Rheinheimera soli]|uniref:response regulator transcription factor n=1 Tax=Rheinheimera soli TaxID=443616 RepID=UPI001E4CC59D|nr:helix-turn-helix transcriptional regulator [Rheinheimera soli]
MTEWQRVADLVSSIRTTDFSQRLATFLKTELHCDQLLLLGCRADKHPIYLYDCIDTKREFLFHHYLMDSYLQDPFYLHAQQATDDGLWRLQDLFDSAKARKSYQQLFTEKTGLHDEFCLSFKLESNRWIVLFIGYREPNQARYQTSYKKLVQLQGLLSAFIRQHWGQDSFVLSSASSEKTGLQHQLSQAFSCFGQQLLTDKEQQIACLLLQGFDSEDIAQQLNIAVGTVKNHRKKIYAKLQIGSLSELFQLFLTHLLAS